MPNSKPVAKISEIPAGKAKCVQVDGRAVAIYNVGGEFFATDDTCTHAEASLSDGQLEGHTIVCPFHFASFNVKTGEVIDPPADAPLRTYPVRAEDDDIFIEV